MTEAGPVLSMCLAFAKEAFEVKSGACGTVVRNAEMKIVDPDTGASLCRNQRGEICIRGAQIMKGRPLSSSLQIDLNLPFFHAFDRFDLRITHEIRARLAKRIPYNMHVFTVNQFTPHLICVRLFLKLRF